jgi:hypothetical protein
MQIEYKRLKVAEKQIAFYEKRHEQKLVILSMLLLLALNAPFCCYLIV